MSRLDDSGEALLHASRDAKNRAQRAWDGFSDFALRDNVLEVAVGLMYHALSFSIPYLHFSSLRSS